MAEISNYAEEAIVKHMLSSLAWTMPTSVLAALWIGNPTDTGAGGTEASGNGYARTTITGGWTVTVGQAQNTDPIVFPACTGSWGGTIDYMQIFDQLGNPLCWTDLGDPKTPSNGDTVQFAALAITVDIA